MSSDAPTGFVLVAVSSAFSNKNLLKEKLEVYLKNIPDADVIALNDARGLVADVLGDRVIDSLGPAMSLREKRALVSSSGWVVLFWDGHDVTDVLHLAITSAKPLKLVSVITTKVVNKDRGDEFDVYIGRGTPWGNPYVVGDGGMDRHAVVAAYREHFRKKFIEDEQGRKDILSLRGKVLGCHCKPYACHGDVIADYLNSLPDGAD